jgi:lysophospholipase L1-like esterase
MKKYLFTIILGLTCSLFAQNMAQCAVIPHLDTIDTSKWALVSTPDNTLKYYAIYDKKYLYLLIDVVQKEKVYAGDGRGFAIYNDNVEIRINRGNKYGYFQLWIDAANQVYLAEKYKIVSSQDTKTATRITPNKGFRIFAAIPWKKLNPATNKPNSIRVEVIRNKVKKPFIYNTTKIVDNLKPITKLISFTVGEKLPSQQHNNYAVMNFGRSGYNSKELLGQMQTILDYKPKLVILLIGTNDVAYKKKWQTPEQFAIHYKNICTLLQKAQTKVILVTLPPCVEEVANKHIKASPVEKAQLNNRIKKMNEYIKNFGKEFNFAVFDYHKFFTGDLTSKNSIMRVPDNSKGNDGIHPNEAGYEIMAKELCKIIKIKNYPQSGIICTGDSITYGAFMEGQGSVIGNTYPAMLLKYLQN